MESDNKKIDEIHIPGHEFYFGVRRIDVGIVKTVLAVLISLTMILVINLGQKQQILVAEVSAVPASAAVRHVVVFPTTDLVQQLKEKNLWDISPGKKISPVVFSSYPDDFHLLDDIALKKKIFLHTLLPSALIVMDEVKSERKTLLSIIEDTGMTEVEIDFADNQDDWQLHLSEQQKNFIQRLVVKYRTGQATLLLRRVDTMPVSLLLAQAAIESSWGSSRFARYGNNIFGIWTWSDRGLIPNEREEGKNHKVKSYDSIIDSVRAYLLNLNRLWAYKEFRELRNESRDSLVLADGLTRYSERGEEYMDDLKKVIIYNRLQEYDKYVLKENIVKYEITPYRFPDFEAKYSSFL